MKTPAASRNAAILKSFRRGRERAAALLAALLMVAPATAHSQDNEQPGIGEQRQAELLYFLKHDCGSCHGLTRSGGLGSPLLAKTLAGRSDDELTEIIMDGLPGTAMPPWKELLSEQEARWLVGALKENKWQK